MANKQITSLPLDQLQPNPFQPREKIKKEDIEDLITSVENYGVIEPLLVAKTPAGYQIIAGERRWRAAKEAGLEEVPVAVRKTSPKEMLELALVENVQREDLNAIERAKGFQRLIREFGFNINKLAEKIGKSKAYISNSMRLLDIPDAVKDGLIEGEITEGHARALAGIEDEQVMIECYRELVRQGASVRQAEQLDRQVKNKSVEESEEIASESIQVHPRIKKLKKKVKKWFEAPTDLSLRRSNRQTRLTITFRGNQKQTEKDLEKIMEILDKKR